MQVLSDFVFHAFRLFPSFAGIGISPLPLNVARDGSIGQKQQATRVVTGFTSLVRADLRV